MLKTTARRGKNNKYGSSFPHTHISTLDHSVALAENTNRCRVTCHQKKNQIMGAACTSITKHQIPKGEENVFGKERTSFRVSFNIFHRECGGTE